ncbi:MAG: transposase [Akkermansia sp.]|nr:transposase [Akkermansia sp.]
MAAQAISQMGSCREVRLTNDEVRMKSSLRCAQMVSTNAKSPSSFIMRAERAEFCTLSIVLLTSYFPANFHLFDRSIFHCQNNKKHSAKIHVFYLPAYSPELNPDELVNADLKSAIGQREPAKNKKELEQQMREHMEDNQKNKTKMANLFKKKSVSYAQK